MNGIELSGPEILELTRLVQKAFDRPSFAKVLLDLGRDPNQFPDTGDFDPDVVSLILRSNREGWVLQLIRSIKKARPHRSDVQAYGPSINLDVAESLPDPSSLETILELANRPMNAGVWIEELQKAMSRVCRIERNGRSYGTGFLVGPRAVLTCYHVIRACLGGSDDFPDEAPSGLALRFDFHAADAGDAGTVCELDQADWLIDHRPPSPVDDRPDPKGGLPKNDDLDFALLQLATSVVKARGWFEPTANGPKPGDPLFILHHPGD